MKAHLLTLAAFLLAAIALTDGTTARAAEPAVKLQMEVLYMNHGPMQPVLEKLRGIFATLPATCKVEWLDVESPAGEAYMRKNRIEGHIPCLIRIDGQSDFKIGDTAFTLRGFPAGTGPKFAQGNWNYDQLRQLLAQKLQGERP